MKTEQENEQMIPTEQPVDHGPPTQNEIVKAVVNLRGITLAATKRKPRRHC